MVNYDIINLTKRKIPEIDKLKVVIDYTLKKEKITNVLFNIVIVNNKKIKELNKEYRHIDKVTDVISFALTDHKDNIKSDLKVLGDVYISIDKAISQSELYKHSLLRELSFLTIHGLLHLLGYDHQTEEQEQVMNKKTEVILDVLEIVR